MVSMLEHVPLLHKQREIYELPKGRERFNHYVAMMTDAAGDMKLPLAGLNPMAGAHVPQLLDAYLSLDVDSHAVTTVNNLMAKDKALANAFAVMDMRTAYVLADDLKGQWTHRVAYEYEQIQAQEPLFRRGWLVAFLWSSEEPCRERAEACLKTSVYRGAWTANHGYGKTLDALIRQEGWVAGQLGHKVTFSQQDLDDTHAILQPLMAHQDEPTLIAALFGDSAAIQLGHTPLGLKPQAGIQWGLYCTTL